MRTPKSNIASTVSSHCHFRLVSGIEYTNQEEGCIEVKHCNFARAACFRRLAR